MSNSNLSSSSFTIQKRNFLHSKLDEVLRIWQRGSGQGSFYFAISDSDPSFQFAINLGFEDVSAPEPSQQHQDLPSRRRKGPAKLAKNRKRAEQYQAAQTELAAAPVASSAPASSAATSASTPPVVPDATGAVIIFPGVGRAVGTGSGPTLPIPLSKGDFFPPHTPTSACAMLAPPATTMVTSSTFNTNTAATSSSHPVSEVLNEVLTEEDSNDDQGEQANACGRCLSGFADSRSGPAYYCPMCASYYHLACGNGHQCTTFDFR